MINIKNGSIQLSDGTILDGSFSFGNFQTTKYYDNQDETRVITLSPTQKIGEEEFVITIRFKNGRLNYISLISTTLDFSEKDEPLRKEHHDKILQNWHVDCGEYNWGRLESEYDKRGNISSINIYYKG